MGWENVKLGSLLNESKIISEKPNANKRIKVKLKVLGVVKRGIENEVEGATKQYLRKAGQFIFGKQNFHKGAFGIIPGELDGFESSSDLPAFDISEKCLPEYLFYFFKNGNYYLELSKIAYGVATQRINTKELFDLEIPLPSVAHQAKIILKLKSLEIGGNRIFSELTNQLSLVKQLRQAFLSEAMQGKLCQSVLGENQETGQQLLTRIKGEKAQLIKDKKLKKEKELPSIKSGETPFEIPKDWVWCRLGEIKKELLSGNAFKSEKYSKTPTNNYVVRLGNVKNDIVDEENKAAYIDDNYSNQSLKHMVSKDDLLITMTGTRGKQDYLYTALVMDKKNKKLFLNQRVGCLRFNNINVNYISRLLKLQSILQPIFDSSTGAANQANIGVESINNALIPLPPLYIQNQIVAKLDELMKTCDDLENSIKQSQIQNEQLLQQVLKEALEVKEI